MNEHESKDVTSDQGGNDFKKTNEEKDTPHSLNLFENETESIEELSQDEGAPASTQHSNFSFESLESIRNRLLDLSGRNSLLNFKYPKTTCIRLIDELPNQIYQVLSEEKKFTIIPVPEPAESELIEAGYIDVDPVTQEKKLLEYPSASKWAKQHIGLDTSFDLPEHNAENETNDRHTDTDLQTLLYAPDLEARLRQIRAKAESAIQESGANILYLALGFLEWYETTESDVPRFSPLFTLPVALEKSELRRGAYKYTIELKDDNLISNITLREKLKKDFNLALPEIEDDSTPENYFEAVQKNIISNQRKWKIRRQAALTLLNFSKQVMYEDLDPQNWPEHSNIEKHPLVEMFFAKEGQENEEDVFGYQSEHKIDDEGDIHHKYPIIYDADSSQHSAIIDIVNGKNVVIEGPPGSGKSQTISNLIASAISNGQSVLFLAEKIAALNVVKERLDKAGLGDFCLELHSHKTNKKKILNDLDVRIQNQSSYATPSELDANIERYEDLKTKLNSYVHKINSEWESTGLTIHEILQKTTRLREKYHIDPEELEIEGISSHNLTLNKRKELIDYAIMLNNIYDQVAKQAPDGDIRNHYWHGVAQVDLDQHKIQELTDSLKAWTENLIKIRLDWNQFLTEKGLLANEDCLLTEIESYLQTIKALPELIGGEPLANILVFNERHEQIQSWLTLYENIHKETQSILENVKLEALLDQESPDKLDKAIESLQRIGVLSNFSVASIQADLQKLINLKNIGSEVSNKLKIIKSSAPVGLSGLFTTSLSNLKEIERLISFVEMLPFDLWKYRDEVFENPDLDSLIDQLMSKLATIMPIHAKLKEDVKLEALPDPATLKNYESILNNAGVFKWLSSEWRHARKSVLSLSLKSKPKTKYFISLLPDIISYAEQQSSMVQINNANPLLKEQFTGVDTPISRISKIRRWYKKIRNEYGIGFGERVQIGSQILSMDRSFAMALLDEANKGLLNKIKQLTNEIQVLSLSHPGVELFKNHDKQLSGDSGTLGVLISSFNEPVETLTSILKNSEISAKEIKNIEGQIRQLHEKEHTWKNSILIKMIKIFDENLSIGPNHFSPNHLDVLRNTLKISQIVSSNQTLKEIFLKNPSDFQYKKLQLSHEPFSIQLNNIAQNQQNFNSIGLVKTDEWLAKTNDSINAIIVKNQNALSNVLWLNVWTDYIRLKIKLSSNGFEKIITSLEDADLNSEDLSDVVSLVIHYKLSKEIFIKNPDLHSLTGLEQGALQERFRSYDKQLLNLQRKKVAFMASRKTPPSGVSYGRVGDFTELSLIKHEISKQKKHIPVRSLLQRAGKSIQILKPCFMMSPMSIAQYLKQGEFEFDLVIMDEASQIRPEDALGAIARGSRLVVVGDPKQLPPTNFFNNAVDDETDDDAVGLQVTESILEAAMPMFNTRRLRWHYRSRHESLIAFSNRYFYDSDLVLFPSPFKSSEEFGIKLKYIPKGRFASTAGENGGRNVEEALAVAKAIEQHLIGRPNESIGVVAMNAKQREEIEKQLDELAKDNTSLYLAMQKNKNHTEPVFIKNLENVQGDERDVIYISMTYGPSQVGGKVMQRFGPINQEVGWRRLNVLFTRSKKRMHIFSSMKSGDILVDGRSSMGVKSLKNFLDYAESGHLEQAVETGKSADSDFEIAVMDALKKSGYECEPQLGVAGFFLDLAVRDPGKPGRFLMGIECDGATYHSAKSARDRDRLRQEILESLGWNIKRIWSTDWFKYPEAQLQPILNELEKLKTVNSQSDSADVLDDLDHDELELIDQEKVVSAEVDALSSNLTIRERLENYDKTVIAAEFPKTQEEQKLLQKAILDLLVEYLPTSKTEFAECVPYFLRSKVATYESKYHLAKVLEIITDFA